MNCITQPIEGPVNLESLNKDQLLLMLIDIKKAITTDHQMATKQDQAFILQEEVTRVMLGLGLTDSDRQTFSGRGARKEKLTSSIAELTEQINGLQGNVSNLSLLRVFYVLVLNGRGYELDILLRKEFPDYF